MVGYAGGSSQNPTYRNIGDHTESIQIVYDPSVISYQDLLEVFWDSHRPTSVPYSRQYKSLVLYHDEEQKRLAEVIRDRFQVEWNAIVYTEIAPLRSFYPAEDYHQKYYLQQAGKLKKEYKAIYPDFKDFVASTAVARVNGYVAGYGTPDDLPGGMTGLGLSPDGEKMLAELTGAAISPQCATP